MRPTGKYILWDIHVPFRFLKVKCVSVNLGKMQCVYTAAHGTNMVSTELRHN
jgi:hypothetical protein